MAKNTNKDESLQTKNEVVVIGEVKENKLAIDKDKINGSLVIQYGKKADEQAEVKVYIGSKKKDGDTNKTYEKVKNLMDEIVSVPNATSDNPATKVKISGKGNFTPSVRLNEFFDEKNNKIVSNIELSLGFGNIYANDDISKDDFKAQFDMVVYLTKAPIRIEDEEGNETLKVEALYVDYQGAVKPVEFIVQDEELMDGIEECEKGSTVNFWGSCKVANVEVVTEKKSGFGGKAKTDTEIFTTRQLIVEGGDPIEEDDKQAIDSKFVKEALAERELFLEGLKNQDKKEKKTKGSFAGSGTKTNTSDDIPF